MVTFASGQAAVSSTNVTFIDAPTLASVTPASGPLVGGTSVTLAGQQLVVLGTPVVTLNGVPCTIVSSTDSAITVRFGGLCFKGANCADCGYTAEGTFFGRQCTTGGSAAGSGAVVLTYGSYTLVTGQTFAYLAVTAAPTTAAPSTAAPTTAPPTTATPTTAAPTTATPSAAASGTLAAAPTTAAPSTTFPTTSAPTTATPTTAIPTTPAPTTSAPTTAAPTTAAPTTSSPTTAAPTTAAPTTAGPTTAGPTTIQSTTAAPTSTSGTTTACIISLASRVP